MTVVKAGECDLQHWFPGALVCHSLEESQPPGASRGEGRWEKQEGVSGGGLLQ